MSFSFETFPIPFWIIILLVSAVPLCILLYKMVVKKSRKSDTTEEMMADILKKATEHWNADNELSDSQDGEVIKSKSVIRNVEEDKKQNIRAVLLDLAERGDTGVLPKSITDKTGISTLDTSTALAYLTENKYAEVINSPSGKKYYLTETGRKYCVSKEFFSDFY